MKEKGAFTVFRAISDPKDIEFRTTEIQPTDNQLQLKDQVERTLVVLKSIFENEDASYNSYFSQLLSLAQAGLVGEHADPEVAQRALLSLQDEVLVKQGGIIKNRYMKKLGIRALIIGLISSIIGIILIKDPNWIKIGNFFLLWTGCMIGTWLSFGIRKMTITFENLHILENDRMEPFVRLIFTGLLTFTIGMIFSLKILTVKMGAISSDEISTNSELAILLGILCGVIEKALADKVKKQATQFLQNDNTLSD